MRIGIDMLELEVNRMRRAFCALLAAASLVGCAKDEGGDGAGSAAPVQEVLVRLPGVILAPAEEVTPGVSASVSGYASLRSILSGDADDLFSVTLGGASEPAGPVAPGASAAREVADTEIPATRAEVSLTNVWVFQFDASGNAVRCEKVDALSAGHPLEVHLNSGDGYTIGVVAGGPASGLSTSNVPDLATFRESVVFKEPVASWDAAPYAGTLGGVRILASGQIQVGDSPSEIPVITLRRIVAGVTVDLYHAVEDYVLDGIELYNVPVGAVFVPGAEGVLLPSASDANFGYRDAAAAGLAPQVAAGGRYTWYMGTNRRGTGAGIAKVQDKNVSKAPAYATYARVKTHSAEDEDAPLYYDIYLGEDMLSDFNVTANYVYNYTARIVGSAKAHYSLLGTDGRVSGQAPSVIESASVTPAGSIPGQGGTYSVILTGILPATGVEVRAISGGGTELVTGKATASGTAVELTVPANNSEDARTVTFEYNRKGTWIKIGDKRSQGGYSVTASHNAPATIPGQGGNYGVTLTGHFPADGVSVRANLAGADPVTGLVMKVGEAVQLTVPGNESWDARTVTFEYLWRGSWIKIGDERSQSGYNVTASHNIPNPIPKGGGTWTVTLTGWRPGDLAIKVVTGSTVLSGPTATTKNPTTNPQRTSVTIPANSGGERAILVYVTTDNELLAYDGKQNSGILAYINRGRITIANCENSCASLGGLYSFSELYNLYVNMEAGALTGLFWTSTMYPGSSISRQVLWVQNGVKDSATNVSGGGGDTGYCRCRAD